MSMFFVVLAAASASTVLYEAQVPTFGCSSGIDVLKLEAVRTAPSVFGQLLTEQVAYGQCVTIPRGSVVTGFPAQTEAPTLLINAASDPPGYVVPSRDFKLK